MNEEFEQLDAQQTESRAFSYFPQVFRKKLTAYMRGEPSAYIGGDANNPDSTSFFRNTLLKPIESVSTGDGFDITRMFDQISLVDEFLALEAEGKSEYALARTNSDFSEQRIKYVLNDLGALFLTDDHKDLRPEIKDLLNEVIPDCYEKLVQKLMPQNPDLSDAEKAQALANAKQIIVDNFMKGVKAVYAQKLLDLGAKKTEYNGWDMNVKVFANASEMSSYTFLQNKLTVIKVEDEMKYYVYGNTDGSNWGYTEIDPARVVNIDFNTQKTLPIKREYRAIYDEIKSGNMHTLSSEDELHNYTVQQEYVKYYKEVIGPMELYNKAPINEDSFVVNEAELISTAELLEQVARVKDAINLQREALRIYDEEIVLPEVKEDVAKADDYLSEKLAEIERVDLLVQEEYHPREEAKRFLANYNDAEHHSTIKQAYFVMLSKVEYDLIEFDTKITRGRDDTTFLRDSERDSDKRSITLHTMIRDERANIREALSLIDDGNEDVDLKRFINSPINNIAVMQNAINQLSNLLANIDSNIENQSVSSALQGYVQGQIKELADIEEDLLRGDNSPAVINRLNNIVYGKTVKVGQQVLVAQEDADFTKVENLVNGLPDTLQDSSLRLNALVKLQRLESYIYQHHNEKSFPYFLKTINFDLDRINRFTDEEVVEFVENDESYALACKVDELDNAHQFRLFNNARLGVSIHRSLHHLEEAAKHTVAVDTAILGLDNLTVYVSAKPDALNVDELIPLILRTKNALEQGGADELSALESPIVAVSAELARINQLQSPEREEKMDSLNQDIQKITTPEQQIEMGHNTSKQRSFKELFGRVVGRIEPDNRDDHSDDAQNKSDGPPSPNIR